MAQPHSFASGSDSAAHRDVIDKPPSPSETPLVFEAAQQTPEISLPSAVRPAVENAALFSDVIPNHQSASTGRAEAFERQLGGRLLRLQFAIIIAPGNLRPVSRPKVCADVAKVPSQPRQFAVTIAVRSWWLSGLLLKASALLATGKYISAEFEQRLLQERYYPIVRSWRWRVVDADVQVNAGPSEPEPRARHRHARSASERCGSCQVECWPKFSAFSGS